MRMGSSKRGLLFRRKRFILQNPKERADTGFYLLRVADINRKFILVISDPQDEELKIFLDDITVVVLPQ
jgi:hypothetical protein